MITGTISLIFVISLFVCIKEIVGLVFIKQKVMITSVLCLTVLMTVIYYLLSHGGFQSYQGLESVIGVDNFFLLTLMLLTYLNIVTFKENR